MTLPPAAGASHTSAGHTAAHWMTREQEAIWINDMLTGGRPCYTVLWEHQLRDAVAPDAFEGALLDVIGRHEFLRSRFLMEDGVPVQCVTVTSCRPVVRECVTEADLGEQLAALAASIRLTGRCGRRCRACRTTTGCWPCWPFSCTI